MTLFLFTLPLLVQTFSPRIGCVLERLLAAGSLCQNLAASLLGMLGGGMAGGGVLPYRQCRQQCRQQSCIGGKSAKADFPHVPCPPIQQHLTETSHH